MDATVSQRTAAPIKPMGLKELYGTTCVYLFLREDTLEISVYCRLP